MIPITRPSDFIKVLHSQEHKYDRNEKRYYKFDKFTQMAGRAGRRDIDEKEYVIIMTNKSLNIKILKDILKLKSSSMNS
uniref:Superkiller viralicidic activity 2-like 2 (inferred by orthology to a human protein) n=1 Tax=Strongyloides venezuelensis TaxID=75913 RepID=A0A0K0FRC8_STRVS